MSEVLNNQKITKRGKNSTSLYNTGSLMTTAANYRAIQQSSNFDILKARQKRNIKMRSQKTNGEQ